MAKAAPRAWQRMLSGRRLDLLDPSPLDIEINDIAHGLARVARWNGQTKGDWSFSVAEHSLLVERLATRFKPGLDRNWRLAALLHDAPEYVTGDLISPFKAAVGVDYQNLEKRISQAVHIRFGLPIRLPKYVSTLIKRADRASAFLEARQLAGFDEKEAKRYFGRHDDVERIRLRAVPPDEAQTKFLEKFHALHKDPKA